MRVLFAGAVCALMFAAAGGSKAQEASPENAAANDGQAAVGEAANEAGQGVVDGEVDAAQGVADRAEGSDNAADGNRATDDASASQGQGDQANRLDAQNDRNARWRFVRHNGEWWYYAPDQQWLYFRGGQWQTFDASVPQQQAMRSGQRRQSFEGGVDAADYATDYATDANAVGATGYTPGAQPIYQGPAYSYQNTGRRYSYSGDATSSAEVSRVPSGSRTGSRYGASTGFNPIAPRMINNNPRSATWGRVR